MSTREELAASTVLCARSGLFVSTAEWDDVRQRATNGLMRQVADELQRRCSEYMDPSCDLYTAIKEANPEPLAQWRSGSANHRAGPLADFATVFMLTGQNEYLEAAEQLMRAVLADQQTQAQASNPMADALGGDLPLAFDFLADSLPTSLHTQVAGYLRHHVVQRFSECVLDSPQPRREGLGVNVFWHDAVVYAWALGAVYDPDLDGPAINQLADLVRRAVHLGIDEAGVIGEGPNYGRYDLFRWCTIAEILRRLGIADLWEEPRLHQALRQWSYLFVSKQRIQAFQDATESFKQAGCYAHLLGARRYNDPLLQDTYERLGGRDATADMGVSPMNLDTLWCVLLWDRNNAKAATPKAMDLPLQQAPGAFGLTVLRSGWDDDDLRLSVHAAGRTSGVFIHQHVDAGHFCLNALGEAFSIDSGYGDKAGRFHSVMMPEGAEAPGTPQGVGNFWFGGHIEYYAAETNTACVGVNIARPWNCLWNCRHFLLIDAPGTEPYVVILDDVNYQNEYGFYDFLINTGPDNRIEVDPAASTRATIHGVRNRLEVAFGSPDPALYPIPHVIELSHDRIDSNPLHHLGAGKRLGAGLRPRLCTRLWGYNGRLLTALIPRRADQAPVAIQTFTKNVQFGLSLNFGDMQDDIIVNPTDQGIDACGMKGESLIAVVRRNRRDQACWSAAVRGYMLEVDGNVILPRQGNKQTLTEKTIDP